LDLSFIVNQVFSYNTNNKYEHEEAARPKLWSKLK
jgi:hypothetical protein